MSSSCAARPKRYGRRNLSSVAHRGGNVHRIVSRSSRDWRSRRRLTSRRKMGGGVPERARSRGASIKAVVSKSSSPYGFAYRPDRARSPRAVANLAGQACSRVPDAEQDRQRLVRSPRTPAAPRLGRARPPCPALPRVKRDGRVRPTWSGPRWHRRRHGARECPCQELRLVGEGLRQMLGARSSPLTTWLPIEPSAPAAGLAGLLVCSPLRHLVWAERLELGAATRTLRVGDTGVRSLADEAIGPRTTVFQTARPAITVLPREDHRGNRVRPGHPARTSWLPSLSPGSPSAPHSARTARSRASGA